jgi:hypothetical protein
VRAAVPETTAAVRPAGERTASIAAPPLHPTSPPAETIVRVVEPPRPAHAPATAAAPLVASALLRHPAPLIETHREHLVERRTERTETVREHTVQARISPAPPSIWRERRVPAPAAVQNPSERAPDMVPAKRSAPPSVSVKIGRIEIVARGRPQRAPQATRRAQPHSIDPGIGLVGGRG